MGYEVHLDITKTEFLWQVQYLVALFDELEIT